MLPRQWSNPDYCYLEPASKIKPERPHQMAVPANHNLGGHVIQLASYLIDMKNYRGFQGYSPFQVDFSGGFLFLAKNYFLKAQEFNFN